MSEQRVECNLYVALIEEIMFRDHWRQILFLFAVAAGMAFSSFTAGLSGFEAPPSDEVTCDLVVYGATSAGVVAAIQAARMGKSAVIIEPGGHLGGLTSGGLGWTDSGNKDVIGGISREFYRLVKKHYDDPLSWKYESRDQYRLYRPDDDAMWTFEPHVAEGIYEDMVREHHIPVFRGRRLDRKWGVKKEGNRIAAIAMESGEVYRGSMFIDATYEGDLLAAAGVTYTVGREGNSRYGETLNGVQKRRNVHKHRFVVPVDPYVVPGDSSSGLLPGVHGGDPGEEGAADNRLQAYCFRLCMSRIPENRIPFPKPEGYVERRYELLFRNFEAGDMRLPLKIDPMPNGKTDTNNNCAFSTDNIGMNYSYPEASYEERRRIIQDHETYQKGLLWALSNHPRVPAVIRGKMALWGLARDEFTGNGNWPHQIYVREARRMVSDFVITESDCCRRRIAPDSVGLGSYNMDSHNVQRYVTPEGRVQNEGDIQVSPGGGYVISYRSIIPRRGEVENLLVPVCVSSSHIAYGSIRMEPVFMILGQSAATAAVMAMDARRAVQDLDYAKLRKRLLEDGQVLDLLPGDRPGERIAAESLGGIVIDDDLAELEGPWVRSTSVVSFVEAGYRHDNNSLKGGLRARFTARLKPGRYEVRLAYTAHFNRATNVPVTIRHSGGSRNVRINQRVIPSINKLFVSLGAFLFDAAKPAVVEVTNGDTDGYVVIDAVQFVKVGSRD